MSERPVLSIPLARPTLGEAESRAAAEALASGWIAQGPRVEAFEKELGRVCGAPHAVAVSSGTAAIYLALRLAGVERGDRVVMPSYTYIATANAVHFAGAEPVFADVEERTLNLSPHDAERALFESGARVLLLVHQLGHPASRRRFGELASQYGASLVDDAACALGSAIAGHGVCEAEAGDPSLVALSFHPRKIITTGEGGALLSGSAELAARARVLRDQGADSSAFERQRTDRAGHEHYASPGFHFRMSDLGAAVGLAQLERLPELLGARRRLAERYDELLAEVPGLTVARFDSGEIPNRQSYAVLLPEGRTADEVSAALARRGIGARRAVMAVHQEVAYRHLATRPLPVTERLASRALAVPLFPGLSDAEQDAVVAALREVLSSKSTSTPR